MFTDSRNDLVDFVNRVRDRYPERLNPEFSTEEVRQLKALMSRRKMQPLLDLLCKTTLLKLCLVDKVLMHNGLLDKKRIKNAIEGYKSSSSCEVCGKPIKIIGSRGCSTACGNLIRNGGFIPEAEKESSLRKYGMNPPFSRKERKLLANILKERENSNNVHGLREKVRLLNTTVDQKLLCIETSTDRYSERVKLAVDGYNSNRCYCGNKTSYSTEDKFLTYCSQKCQANSGSVRDKTKSTMTSKYGGSSCLNSPVLAAKVRSTMRSKYGADNPSKISSVVEKKKATLRRNYGVDNPSKSSEIQRRKVKTSLRRYGTRNPSQNAEVQAKILKSCYKSRRFKLAGRYIWLQGYELQALRIIINDYGVPKTDIEVQSDGTIPTFNYIDSDGKLRKYIPDFCIGNRIVEVKSTYTIATCEDNWETNKRKFQSVKDTGFKFSLMVLDKGRRLNMPKRLLSMSYEDVKAHIKAELHRLRSNPEHAHTHCD